MFDVRLLILCDEDRFDLFIVINLCKFCIDLYKKTLDNEGSCKKIVNYLFTFFFNSAPALNEGVLVAGMLITAPVCGLRPSRAERSVTLKVPKPTNCTRSPDAKASLTVCNNASKAIREPDKGRPERFAICSISSDLFI